MSDGLILSRSYQVTSADTDMFSRLRPGSLINLLIQSAIESADKLGFGLRDLHKRKLIWVLSRLTLEIYKPAKWYNELIVETWPKDIDGLLYLRDFLIKYPDGTEVAKATSGWLAIDINSKRPGEVEPEARESFVELKNKHAIESTPIKLNPISEGESFEVPTTYYDIDLNGHVTSTRYVDWMMDTIPLEFHRENYPKQIIINYLKEVLPLETVRISRYSTSKEMFDFEGVLAKDDRSCFRGKLTF